MQKSRSPDPRLRLISRPRLAATAPTATRAGSTTVVTPPHVTARAKVTLPGLRCEITQRWTCSSTPGTADPCPATQMVSRANVRPAAAGTITAVARDHPGGAGVTRGRSTFTPDSPAEPGRGPVTSASSSSRRTENLLTDGPLAGSALRGALARKQSGHHQEQPQPTHQRAREHVGRVMHPPVHPRHPDDDGDTAQHDGRDPGSRAPAVDP